MILNIIPQFIARNPALGLGGFRPRTSSGLGRGPANCQIPPNPFVQPTFVANNPISWLGHMGSFEAGLEDTTACLQGSEINGVLGASASGHYSNLLKQTQAATLMRQMRDLREAMIRWIKERQKEKTDPNSLTSSIKSI